MAPVAAKRDATDNMVEPVIPPEAAATVVCPAARPVAKPVALIVATPVADEVHAAVPVRFCVLPLV